MNKQITHQKGRKNSIEAQKLYTQDDVDKLFKNNEDGLTSQEKEIENDTKSANKQKRKDNRTVANLVKKSNRILVSISSHAFPFDPFPNTINVEEERITVINRHMFSSEVHSVDIKDISNIFINTSLLYSQLVIISKTYEENEIKMRNLRTKEAVFIRRIIEGLRVFENKKINTSNYTKEELINKLEKLSTTGIVM